MTTTAILPDPIAELRKEYRSRIDELPYAELVVPSEIARRKSGFLAIESELVPRDVVFQLVREAIDEAFEQGRREGATVAGDGAGQ